MAKKVNRKPVPKPVPKVAVKNNAPVQELKKSWPPVTKYALFLGILAFCTYANTLRNDYTNDDVIAIKNNKLVKKGIAAIPEILSTPYQHGFTENGIELDALYRPLSLVMFTIEYQLSPGNPLLNHLINIFVYVGCVILLFLFLYYLFKKERPVIAFIGALLFAIHPIHTEVVANIKSRDELLCFFFGLLSLVTFIKYIDTNKRIFLFNGLLFYFLSLLSKETSIAFVALIPLVFFFYRNENKKMSISISLFSLLPIIIYLIIRSFVLITYHAKSMSDIIENPLYNAPGGFTRFATEILILGHYIKLLIIPYPLICDYGFNAVPFANFTNIGVWVSIVVYALLIFLGFTRLFVRTKLRSSLTFSALKYDPVAFGILFYLITIAIFSNIFFLIGAEMAERFLFFPSAGFCIVIAFMMEQLVFRSGISGFQSIKNKKVWFVLIPVSLIFIIITVNRDKEWQDDLTLFKADSKKSPNNFYLHYMTSVDEIAAVQKEDVDAITKQQNYTEAITELRKSIIICPAYSPAQEELAYAFMLAKQSDSAILHYKKALMINPINEVALNYLAVIYYNDKKYNETIELDRKAYSINPANSDYVSNIGACYLQTNHPDSAIYYFEKALDLDPAKIVFAKYIVSAFSTIGQTDSAKKYEALVRRSEPNFKM